MKEVRCTKADDITGFLTKGKNYQVIEENDISYFVYDDKGVLSKFSKARFEEKNIFIK